MKEVRELVENYFKEHGASTIPVSTLLNDGSKDHIINIGTSILCTKWGIGYPGGSFVQAVVNNNVMEAIGRADNINVHALKFYCQLMYNVGMPINLIKE
jgi:hypothetical protein